MRFGQTLFAGAALIAAAFGVEFTVAPFEVTVGQGYSLKYSPDEGSTTIILQQGPSGNLKDVATLTSDATGGTYQWNVDTSLPNGDDYALKIQQGNGTPNYWGPIKITGSTASASSSASSSSASSSEESSSSTKASTVTTTATTASASASITVSGNSTISSATLSRTGSASSNPTGSSTESAGAPQNTNGATLLGSSPLALIFGAVAAMAYLN